MSVNNQTLTLTTINGAHSVNQEKYTDRKIPEPCIVFGVMALDFTSCVVGFHELSRDLSPQYHNTTKDRGKHVKHNDTIRPVERLSLFPLSLCLLSFSLSSLERHLSLPSISLSYLVLFLSLFPRSLTLCLTLTLTLTLNP